MNQLAHSTRIAFALVSLLLVFISVKNAVAQIEYGPNNIYSIAWSPDGSQIAVGSGPQVCNPDDNSAYAIRILDAVSGAQTYRLQYHTCNVESVAWSPDGSKLVSGSTDGTIILWDVVTEQPLYIASGDSPGPKDDLDWRPDGSQYLARDHFGSRVFIFDAATGEIDPTADPLDGHAHDRISDADWSPNGERIATSSGENGYVHIFDAPTRSLLMTLTGHSPIVLAVQWSPDSTKLASGDRSGTVIIWNAAGEALQLILVPSVVHEIAWNPEGTQIATASDDGFVRVWDVETGELVGALKYPGIVYTVDWSPDGNRLAYGGAYTELESASVEIAPAPGRAMM